MKAIQAHIDGKTPSALIEHRMLCKDGSWKWILGRGMVVSHDSDGKPLRLVGTNTDITERKAVEVRDQLLVAALEAVGEGVVITDAKAKIEWANTAFETLTGYTREKAVGSRLAELVKSGLQDQPFYEAMWRTILDGAHWRGELVNKRKDGSLYHEELAIAPVKSVMGEIGHFVGVKRDISERKRLEAELHEMATTDLLTGLPNRRHFMARLEEELARVLRLEHQLAAVLMIDLDHFKQVNDNFGHAVGDSVLRHFAALMREGLRKIDTGGRIGGEEFAIILPGADGDAARTFAERLRHKTEQTPLTLASQTTIPLTVSIGIAAIDAADASPDAALVRADEALYRAKSMGRNRVVGYKLSVTDVVPLN
jgi:diguanylate cyclase (GGDEF)-like protein/PAS domain S-box-containing protein